MKYKMELQFVTCLLIFSILFAFTSSVEPALPPLCKNNTTNGTATNGTAELNSLQNSTRNCSTQEEIDAEMIKNGLVNVPVKDCFPAATKKALDYLKDGSKKKDCTDHLTDFTRLRAFLASSEVNFIGKPGSLVFANAQDHVLKLECTEKGSVFKEYFKWTVEELPTGNKEARSSSAADERAFVKAGYKSRRIVIKAPPDADYYRRYTCESNNKQQCKHEIHVITRPYPKLSMAPQYSDGKMEVEMTCAVHTCLYKYTKDRCKVHPRPQYNYKTLWSLPKAISKTQNATCYDGIKLDGSKPVAQKHYFHDPESNMSNFKDSKIGIKFDILEEDIGTKGDRKLITIGSVMKIEKMKREMRGEVECIIIDRNGVASSPTHGSLDHLIRFSGVRTIHVRGIVWTIVPASILFAMIIIILIIQLACPLRMELDDGSIVSMNMGVAPEDRGDKNEPTTEGEVPSSKASVSPRPMPSVVPKLSTASGAGPIPDAPNQ